MQKNYIKYFFAGATILILVIVGILFSPKEWTTLQVATVIWIVLAALLLWFGNSLISRLLDKKITWLQYGNIRFFLQLFIIIVYSLSVINGLYLGLKIYFTDGLPTLLQLLVTNVYGALIIIPMSSIYFGLYFLKSWNKSQLEAERLQKESAKAKFKALVNHLDPHFLFNNLNILSALIDIDTKQSQKYLEKFAEVYRVVLQTDNDQLVSLRKELEFVEAYIYLINIRFEDLLSIEIKIPESKKDAQLPPLTLQMLIENAMKHNIITEERPLSIKVSAAGNFLTIKNSLNQKPMEANNTGSGLENIAMRYEYFTDNKLVIENNGTEFIVKAPLIEVEEV
jgi:sensor histidine kinase YesM